MIILFEFRDESLTIAEITNIYLQIHGKELEIIVNYLTLTVTCRKVKFSDQFPF